MITAPLHLGVQWTADLMGCDHHIIDDVERIAADMLHAAKIAGTTIIDSRFHKFSPQGVSGVIVIAESHIAIHTWPEQGYVALDLFSCGDKMLAEEAIGWLAGRFGATRIMSAQWHRGDVRRLERLRLPRSGPPRHPELFRYDDTFMQAFIHPGLRQPIGDLLARREVREIGEQIYQFQLFTPAWCAKLIDEFGHQGGWGDEPDAPLSWKTMPALDAVYGEIVEHHVRPILEGLWERWRLWRWDPPVVCRQGPGADADMDLRHDAGAVTLIGSLNDGFEGGGIGFPRWGLTVGDAGCVQIGSVVVFPSGVSHEHLACPVTAGQRYTLASSLYLSQDLADRGVERR